MYNRISMSIRIFNLHNDFMDAYYKSAMSLSFLFNLKLNRKKFNIQLKMNL